MEKLQFLLTKDGFRIDDILYAEKETREFAGEFAKAPYEALYELAFRERPECFDAAGVFLFQVAESFAEALVNTSGLELSREKTELVPREETIELLLDSAPFVLGAEFVTRTWVKRQYRKLLAVFAKQIKGYSGKVSLYFAEKNQKLHVPERVFFHLVENHEGEFPFAFLATYATKGDGGRVRHVPLQYALTEYRDERSKLLELLSCLNKAAEVSALIGGFMESGELFHPLGLTADEAYQFLNDVSAIEGCGILCRIPNWWKKRYNAFAVTVKMGEEKPSLLGLDALLHMAPSLTVGGVPLTAAHPNRRLILYQGQVGGGQPRKAEKAACRNEAVRRRRHAARSAAVGIALRLRRKGRRAGRHQRKVAGRLAEESAQSAQAKEYRRSRRLHRRTATVSGGWLPMAAANEPARLRRVSRGRYGTRQNGTNFGVFGSAQSAKAQRKSAVDCACFASRQLAKGSGKVHAGFDR